MRNKHKKKRNKKKRSLDSLVYSLDSDTVNGLLRGNLNLIRRVQAEPASDIWISTIVVGETVGKQINHINTLRSHGKPFGRESGFLARLLPALTVFQILPYTDKAEQLFKSWPTKIKGVGPNDCRIAASAILAGFTVITGNGKDFSAIPGAVLEDWSQSNEEINDGSS